MDDSPRHFSKRVHRAIVMLVATAVGVLAGYILWKSRLTATPDDPLNPLGFSNIAASVAYVGDGACRECHGAIGQTYARTAMARSWRQAVSAVSIEDYGTDQEIVDNQTGYRYRVYRQGDRIFHREYRVNEQGTETYSQVREVAYVLGSGIKGRSYVTDSNGHLAIMPVAWYGGTKKWDLNPGYQSSNLRFSRQVVPECIMCHNSYPLLVAGANNRYRPPMPEGIGCERCHGAGELHVNLRRANGPVAAPIDLDRTIVNPAKLPHHLQQDVCLQCHLSTQGGAVFHHGKTPFDFRPGQPLSAFRADFELSGVAGAEISAISHGTRLAKSRCFSESHGKLTCIHCHDPHVPTQDVPRRFFSSRCLACHTTQSCNRPTDSVSEAVGSTVADSRDCIACHMPKRETSDIRHTVATDHWIRRNPGQVSEVQEADALNSREFVPLEDFFQAAETGDRGIAHVRYGFAKDMPEYVTKGITLLRQALDQKPGDGRWQYWLGYTLRRQGKLKESQGLLEQALRNRGGKANELTNAELIDIQLETTQLYLQIGLPRRALEVCDSLLQTTPDCLAAYELAVRVHVELGDPEGVLRSAGAGLELDPTDHYLWGMQGLSQFAFERDALRSLQSLNRALELEPLEPTTYVLLSEVHESLVQEDQAEAVLLQAIKIDSESIPCLLALAKFYIRHGRAREAVPRLRHVLSKSPGNPDALILLRATK